MADRNRKRVRRIVRFGYLFELKQGRDHYLYLLLVRLAVTDDRLLDLKRSVFENMHALLPRREEYHASRLRDLDRRRLVGIEEKLFDRHVVGLVFIDQLAH